MKEYKQKLFDDLLKRKKEVRKKIMNMTLNSHSNNISNNINKQQQNLKVKKKKIINNSKHGK